MTLQKIFRIIGLVLILLAIPFSLMIFTNEVNWGIFDFLVMGGLLFISIFAIVFIKGQTIHLKLKILLAAMILIIVTVIWVELAVGIFNSPLAGT